MVAWCCCQTVGLDSSANSIPYLTGWAEHADLDVLEQTAGLTSRLADRIEAALIPAAAPTPATAVGSRLVTPALTCGEWSGRLCRLPTPPKSQRQEQVMKTIEISLKITLPDEAEVSAPNVATSIPAEMDPVEAFWWELGVTSRKASRRLLGSSSTQPRTPTSRPTTSPRR